MIEIKSNINNLDKEVKEMKENQLYYFKKRHDHLKKDNRNKIQYDLKYTMLFGNGIVI